MIGTQGRGGSVGLEESIPFLAKKALDGLYVFLYIFSFFLLLCFYFVCHIFCYLYSLRFYRFIKIISTGHELPF